MKNQRRWAVIASIAVVVIGIGMAARGSGSATRRPAAASLALPVAPGGGSTTRGELTQTIARMERQLAARPDDERAAVALADALMRQARVTGDAMLPKRAEVVLLAVAHATDGYDARRMLGVVYLGQHRFLEAREAGRAASARRPNDAWNYGVIGDASIELGDYPEAFAAFDKMARIKPNAAAYARVAYARELTGDLDGALAAMQMAAEGTSAHDPEGQAWAFAQLGNLYLHRGALDDAWRAFSRAAFVFPDHPYALHGLARVAMARENDGEALRRLCELYARAQTPELAAEIGDLEHLAGHHDRARAMWAEAEALERAGWANESPQRAALARMLAERGLKTADAVALASEAVAERHDIATCDALAWALYRAGRYDEAWSASEEARRTGTRDRRILYHAAAIAAARGDEQAARRFAERAVEGHPRFDLIAAPEARALLERLPAEPAH